MTPKRDGGALVEAPVSGHSGGYVPPKRITQLDRVRSMLLEADEVCTAEFCTRYLFRFSVWIHELRKAGHVITKRPCDRHVHEDICWLYRLEALPHDPTEVGGGR